MCSAASLSATQLELYLSRVSIPLLLHTYVDEVVFRGEEDGGA